ncbi:NAD-dependent epimerase/dehydratase family protein [Bradyrhizobium cenepequi]
MNILVLGGTQFVGRHIVEACLRAGHAVSILTRGKTVDELPSAVERLRGDRDQGATGLASLAGRSWDACVDVSGYTPRQVRASAERLSGYVKRYVFISSVSVYVDDPARHPIVETDPVLPAATEDVTDVNGDTYGPLKVACETIVREIHGDRATVLLRPQIIAGPYDQANRYTYWLNRATLGGEMLAPGDGTDHVQVIDARDLSRFVVTVIENGHAGVFNLAGPRMTWASFMALIGAAQPVWVSADLIKAAGLTFVELPLFRPDGSARSSQMDMSTERARAAGLTLTAPEVTVRETRAWSLAAGLPVVLPPEREAELIRLSRVAAPLSKR